MQRLVLIFFVLLLTGSASAQQVTFSQKQLLDDFDYMEKALREVHPGLYLYQTRGHFDSSLAMTRKGIKDNTTLRDAYAQFSLLIAGIRCTHTVIVPSANWADTLKKAHFYFPFQVYFFDGEPYLTFNRSPNQDIHPGDKLLSINGRPLKAIKQEIFRHLFSDGYIETLKYRQIHNYMFSYYYNCFIEQADSFHIQYENAAKEVREATVAASGMEEMNRNTVSNPVNRSILEAAQKEKQYSKELLLDKKQGIATIILREFYGGSSATVARNRLVEFMDRSMKQIKKNGITDLVVDLRFNSGGYDNQGQILLSYFIKEPVLYYKSMHTVTNNSPLLAYASLSREELAQAREGLIRQPDGTYPVTSALNNTLDSVKPRPDRFTGSIWFLVNGSTGSATAEFTAVAHHLRLGTFVGEETGGNYTGGTGAEFIGLLLPNTKMHLTIPLVSARNAVTPPMEEGHGTIPDYPVNYTLDDLLKGADTPLEFVYKLIGSKHPRKDE